MEMKVQKQYLVLILVLTTTALFAQGGTAKARTTATIVEPITYTKAIDLNFASMSIVVAGTVELVPKDLRSAPGNITLPVTMGTFTAVSYVVSGTTAYTYKINVPVTPLEVNYGNHTLIARSLDTGAMQYSDSDLLAGVFVSISPMNVTVNYN